MHLVGNRYGQYRALVNLLRNSASWDYARMDYHNITVPVLLVWGDQDWTRIEDRDFERKLVPSVCVHTVESSGHFLPLDSRTRSLRRYVTSAIEVGVGKSGYTEIVVKNKSLDAVKLVSAANASIV